MTLAVSALTQGRNGIDVPDGGAGGAGARRVSRRSSLVERRVAAPLLDPELLTHPRFRAATAGSLVLGAGMIGMASFTPTMVQLGYGRGLWAASLPVVAWAGTGVVASLLVRTDPAPARGATAGGPVPRRGRGRTAAHLGTRARLVAVAAGRSRSCVAGVGTGVLNALLGREAIASVPPDRAAMGSGANNTARYLGAACGITLFVTVATHAGDDLFAGWNAAALVTVGLTLLGAGGIALSGRRAG